MLFALFSISLNWTVKLISEYLLFIGMPLVNLKANNGNKFVITQ